MNQNEENIRRYHLGNNKAGKIMLLSFGLFMAFIFMLAISNSSGKHEEIKPVKLTQKQIQTQKYKNAADNLYIELVSMRAKRLVFHNSMTVTELFILDLKIYEKQSEYDQIKETLKTL